MIDHLEPIKFVVERASHVKVSQAAIDNFVKDFQPTKIDHWLKACPFEYHELPDRKAEITRRFLQDAQAFCYWGKTTKWTTKYQGQYFDGWWGFLAAMQHALESGIPLLDSHYLATMSEGVARAIFAGNPEIPLVKERHQIFNAIGKKLVADFEGDFNNYLTSAPSDAWELVQNLATTFPDFDDTALYQSRVIPFYKKAQLLVDELGDDLGVNITGLDQLLGKADYKIPALQRKLGILEYSPKLARLVDSRRELRAGMGDEVEIRSCMLYANHLICQGLAKAGHSITPMQLDGILWVQSQSKSSADKPYHLTLTTNY